MTEEITPSWEVRTLAHAYRERPPTEYVIDKFFATESLNIVYGAPGVMKSMILADACAHVVQGSAWLPGAMEGGITCYQSPVLWLDMDNGTRRTDERFDAIGRAVGLQPDDPLYYVSMPNPALVAGDLDSMMLFRDLIWEYGARLVVVDNLGLITGEVEENSAAMAQIMGNLRTLAERTKAAVILIHHQRKGGANNSRAGDALRGHSSIEAAVDLALHIVRERDSSELSIRSTKTRGVDVPSVIARFNFEHRPGTNDLARAWFDGIPLLRGDNPIRDAILQVLEDGDSMTKGRVADAAYELLNGEHGINKIRNWIGEMISVTGELEVESGTRGAQVLRLA